MVVLIKTGLNQDKPEETLPSDSAGETVQATNDEPTIGVEETEPSLGGGGEIDFDDLIEAAHAG